MRATGGGWQQQQRAIALLAILLGMVCLHAIDPATTAAPDPARRSPDLATTPTTAQPAHHLAGLQIAAATATADLATPHDGGHDCLAVPAVSTVFALADAALTARTHRRADAPPQRRVIVVRPRPPPPIAVRLAQLSVLRN